MFLTLLWHCGLAQSPAPHRSSGVKTEPVATLTGPKKLTPRQQQGLQLLQAAEAEASALEPGTRAFLLWRLSQAYASLDPKRSASLVKESFLATTAIESLSGPPKCGNIKPWLQWRILSGMIEAGSLSQAEGLLTGAEPDVAGRATSRLIKAYISKKRIAHAEELLHQLADGKEYPYEGAAELLAALGPEQAGDRLFIFNQALANFEQNGSIAGTHDVDDVDMGTLVERSWQRLPSPLVLEAIDKLLDEARSSPPRKLIAGWGQGKDSIVSLNSTYELRLFQLLPILQELDKDKAESLLRDDAELRTKLEKHSNEMGSLDPANHGEGFSDDERLPEALAVVGDLDKQLNQINKELETDPARALAHAVGMPLGTPKFPFSIRLLMLGRVATDSAKKNPAIAKAALDEIAKLEDQLVASQLSTFPDLPEFYVQVGDNEGAEKAVSTMLKIARKLYAWDTDSDDPNQAFKAMWPSTVIWQRTLRAADKLSPALVQEVIADIPDPEIAAVVKLQQADVLVGKHLGVEGAVCHKNVAPVSFTMY